MLFYSPFKQVENKRKTKRPIEFLKTDKEKKYKKRSQEKKGGSVKGMFIKRGEQIIKIVLILYKGPQRRNNRGKEEGREGGKEEMVVKW